MIKVIAGVVKSELGRMFLGCQEALFLCLSLLPPSSHSVDLSTMCPDSERLQGRSLIAATWSLEWLGLLTWPPCKSRGPGQVMIIALDRTLRHVSSVEGWCSSARIRDTWLHDLLLKKGAHLFGRKHPNSVPAHIMWKDKIHPSFCVSKCKTGILHKLYVYGHVNLILIKGMITFLQI